MSTDDRSRNLLATVIGWLLVAFLAWMAWGVVVGTLRWLLRTVVIIAVIVGLLWAYLALKTPDD